MFKARSPSPLLLTTTALYLALGQPLLATGDVLRAKSADGVDIVYEVAGDGAPTLVFIHGWNCDRRYWAAQLGHYARDYRVVALDLAGHGESGSERQEYTMASFADDVVAVTEGGAPLVLIGHSMGASVMLEAAAVLGERVLGMVVVDALHQVPTGQIPQDMVESQLQPLRDDFDAAVRPVVQNMFLPGSNARLRDWVVEDMLAADRRVSISAVRGMMSVDLQGIAPELKAPMVVINSSSRPTNVAALRAFHANTEVHLMDDVGHFLMMEKPEEFHARLDEAIASFQDQ